MTRKGLLSQRSQRLAISASLFSAHRRANSLAPSQLLFSRALRRRKKRANARTGPCLRGNIGWFRGIGAMNKGRHIAAWPKRHLIFSLSDVAFAGFKGGND